jgi:hypothetical protein
MDITNGQTITKQSLEGLDLDGQGFARFERRTPVLAKRMQGEFTVETSEGTVTCPDGWLAIDDRGYPYPIAAAEFELGFANYGEGGDTIKERVDDAIAQLYNLRTGVALEGEGAREFSLAITALEDAKARVTRGLALMHGWWVDVDLQTERGAELWQQFYGAVTGTPAGTPVREAATTS